MGRLDWRVVGISMGLFLTVSYVICVAYDLLFGQQMYQAWLGLLPGFAWISWSSFFLGLIETFLYGVYFGLVFVPLYNFFHDRFAAKTEENGGTRHGHG